MAQPVFLGRADVTSGYICLSVDGSYLYSLRFVAGAAHIQRWTFPDLELDTTYEVIPGGYPSGSADTIAVDTAGNIAYMSRINTFGEPFKIRMIPGDASPASFIYVGDTNRIELHRNEANPDRMFVFIQHVYDTATVLDMEIATGAYDTVGTIPMDQAGEIVPVVDGQGAVWWVDRYDAYSSSYEPRRLFRWTVADGTQEVAGLGGPRYGPAGHDYDQQVIPRKQGGVSAVFEPGYDDYDDNGNASPIGKYVAPDLTVTTDHDLGGIEWFEPQGVSMSADGVVAMMLNYGDIWMWDPTCQVDRLDVEYFYQEIIPASDLYFEIWGGGAMSFTPDGTHFWVIVYDSGYKLERYTYPDLALVESSAVMNGGSVPYPAAMTCSDTDVWWVDSQSESGPGDTQYWKVYHGLPGASTLLTSVLLHGGQADVNITYNPVNEMLYLGDPGSNYPDDTQKLWEIDPGTGAYSMVFDTGVYQDPFKPQPTITPNGVIWMPIHGLSVLAPTFPSKGHWAIYDPATSTGTVVLADQDAGGNWILPQGNPNAYVLPQPDNTVVFATYARDIINNPSGSAEERGWRRTADGVLTRFTLLDSNDYRDVRYLSGAMWTADAADVVFLGNDHGFHLWHQVCGGRGRALAGPSAQRMHVRIKQRSGI